MDNQVLEEISYPLNDVLLSSSSDVIHPFPAIAASAVSATKRTRSRTTAAEKRKFSAVNSSRESSSAPNQPHDATTADAQQQFNPIVSAKKLKNNCQLCHKQFVHVFALNRHLATHNLASYFTCPQCSKSFKNQSTLTAHMATHSQNLPFTCELCQKSFNRLSTLKSHRRIHSGAKPFVCHVCNKAFYQKGNLKNHLYIHTNERPYRCEICTRGFNQMSNLMCHKKNAHHVLPPSFYCQYCEMQFSRPEQLTNHELEAHVIPETHLAMRNETQLIRVQTYVDPQSVKAALEDETLDAGEEISEEKSITMDLEENIVVEEVEEEEEVKFEEELKSEEAEEQKEPINLSKTTTAAEDAMNLLSPQTNNMRNCQMVYEKTENHPFFSKFSVIELPQKIETLEIRYAEMVNKIPCAMLHFGEAPPCLVEIVQQREMSILKPIKKHELQRFICATAGGEGETGGQQSKALITIVATILQSYTESDYCMFTVKSPEIVHSVMLLVDNEKSTRMGGLSMGNLASLANCARADELQELKNKITIVMGDCRL